MAEENHREIYPPLIIQVGPDPIRIVESLMGRSAHDIAGRYVLIRFMAHMGIHNESPIPPPIELDVHLHDFVMKLHRWVKKTWYSISSDDGYYVIYYGWTVLPRDIDPNLFVAEVIEQEGYPKLRV